jgi:nickel-dependent lactate racemase
MFDSAVNSMMNISLAYGKTGLTITVPNDADVLTSRHATGLPDEVEAIRTALQHPIGSIPLRDTVKRGARVVIVHTDITRATPNARLLPPLLAELEHAGIRRADITLLNALGTHRRQSEAELRLMLGDFLVDNYRCLQHDAWDDANLVSFGETSFGHPVRINRIYAEADVKILTGLIEPHFFAGFSGGPKGVLPSIAGFESVLSNHGREMIGHPKATWGVTVGNPIWEEMREMALRTKPTFLVNVAINTRRQITGIFAGEMLAAHAAGCAFVGAQAFLPIRQLYDVVIATNSGYPLDLNLYQTVKGMSAALQAVRPGGAILMCSACNDGLPDHGKYAELLQEGGSPQGILNMLNCPGFSAHDQWEVQIQAKVQLQADVHIYSDGLTDEQICRALLVPIRDLGAGLEALQGRYGPRMCILPNGPETIPTLQPV